MKHFYVAYHGMRGNTNFFGSWELLLTDNRKLSYKVLCELSDKIKNKEELDSILITAVVPLEE
jgi:hypothetical protein